MPKTGLAEAGVVERTHGAGMLRVLVVDDSDLVQCGFRLLLGRQPWIERCLPARDVVTAVALARRFEPQVAVLNADALDCVPAAFVRGLRQVAPGVRVLLLTHANAVATSTLLAIGVDGFLPDRSSARDLLGAIRFGDMNIPASHHRTANAARLSARQHEILDLIADGATNAEIATRLYLSRHTVKQHTSALYKKLGVRNRIHAIQTAQRQGLIAI